MKRNRSFIKKCLVGVLATLIISTSVIGAGAVTNLNTGTYTMGGYKLYGSITVYADHADGFTYCANTAAGKIARTSYCYRDKSGVRRVITSGSTSYTYNKKNSLSVVTKNATNMDSYLGAMTVSKVTYPNQKQYTWTSEGLENELRLGCYKR